MEWAVDWSSNDSALTIGSVAEDDASMEESSLTGTFPGRASPAEHILLFGKSITFYFREVEVASLKLAARKFIREEEGAALAEYGILVAFIAIVAITAVTFFGSKISTKFSQLANSFT